MAANITTIVDLPSVGKNMSDHPISSAIYQTTSNNTWLTHLDPAVVNQEIGFWAATKQGGLSGQVANILGWLRLPSNDSVLRQSGDPSNGPTSAHYEFVFLVSRKHTLFLAADRHLIGCFPATGGRRPCD
jgi:hypothetical protein